LLADWHVSHPDHLGMAEAAIVQALRGQATPAVARAAIRSALDQGMLVRERLLLRLPSHAPQLQGEERDLLARIEPHLRGGGLRPPIVGEAWSAKRCWPGWSASGGWATWSGSRRIVSSCLTR
jgi:hypothetical protein